MNYKDEEKQFNQSTDRVIDRMEKLLDCMGFEYSAKGYYDGSFQHKVKDKVSLPVQGSAADILQDSSLKSRIEGFLDDCYHAGYDAGCAAGKEKS